MADETIFERIARLEREGRLDPNCRGCAEHYRHYHAGKTEPPFAPPHKASETCRSGKHNHCTCDSCF